MLKDVGVVEEGAAPLYSRIVLKLSGEAVLGAVASGLDLPTFERVASEVARVHARGVQIAVIIGGGNIVRGMEASLKGLDRVTGDYMGMLATVINALAMRAALEQLGLQCRVLSAIEMHQVAEPFIPRRAVRHLEKGRIVILCAGTGSPFFSTDTAAALRAAELNAQVLLKATKVDGIYTEDPVTHPSAEKLPHLTYMDALNRGIAVMDSTALTLCKDNQMPIIVFDIFEAGSIEQVVMGEKVGTRVDGGEVPIEKGAKV